MTIIKKETEGVNEEAKGKDFVMEGLHRLDPSIVVKKAPKIAWGDRYKMWPDVRKIKYLDDLACTMNHAAYLIQLERDELNVLCEKKEKMIIAMSSNLEGNNGMIQQQMMKLNEERQLWNKAAADMKAKIRELESEIEDK